MADLLPVHYFEKAPVVRVIWELWISIKLSFNARRASDSTIKAQRPQMMSQLPNKDGRVDAMLLQEISCEFNQRMLLLQNGFVKVSRDPSDYPIHKAVFDGSLE